MSVEEQDLLLAVLVLINWTGELCDLLGKCEEDRQTYPTLESFMPEVVKSFNELAAPPAP